MASEQPRLEPGFVYPAYETVVTAAYQREKHACCGVDMALYGPNVDIALLAYETILAGRRTGLSINGNVHVGQSFEVAGPLLLDERLLVRGEVCHVAEAARGRVISSVFEFSRPDGSVALRTIRRGLQPGPVPAPDEAQSSKPVEAGEKAEFSVLGFKRLEPAKVADFTKEAENLIHSDPEVARSFGFRAPIAAGVIAISFMTEALLRRGVPERFSMEVAFKRPMFWDEELRIEGASSGADGTTLQRIRVSDGRGKELNAAEIRASS